MEPKMTFPYPKSKCFASFKYECPKCGEKKPLADCGADYSDGDSIRRCARYGYCHNSMLSGECTHYKDFHETEEWKQLLKCWGRK